MQGNPTVGKSGGKGGGFSVSHKEVRLVLAIEQTSKFHSVGPGRVMAVRGYEGTSLGCVEHLYGY